ncbi:MAG: hydroxymethylglutaryl-CoA synthase [Thermoplasmata archaeon]|nr:hydroxymethylglutaryl-CoA synthase [Thermoplasmata archaeon]
MDIGIITYGAYVPRLRIKSEEIAKVWGEDPVAVSKGLNVQSKSVPGPDEDVVTISVEAARAALQRCELIPSEIGAIYVGSESHPYAVKPTATIVAEAIQAGPNITAADFEFACKAGTAALQTCMGLVSSEMIKYGLAIGADTSQGAPGNALEYAASAGGAAFIIGKGDGVIATLNETLSFTTDTPDFWRREGQKYPSHGERFTGKPAYFRHTMSCSQNLLAKLGTEPKDYNYAVFHQPNGKFPIRVAKMLGFSTKQIETGMLTPKIGNTYSGSTMIGLAAILDIASPGDRIFAVSYGSGAGSDGFDITVTDEITNISRDDALSVEAMISNTRFIDYAIYAKYREKLKLEGE